MGADESIGKRVLLSGRTEKVGIGEKSQGIKRSRYGL